MSRAAKQGNANPYILPYLTFFLTTHNISIILLSEVLMKIIKTNGIEVETSQSLEEIGHKLNNPPIAEVHCRPKEKYYWYYLLRRRGVKLVCDLDKDKTDLIDYLIDMEKADKGAVLQRGRTLRSIQGEYSGGMPPYGYKVVNGVLVIKENEAEVVRLIFKMKEEGLPMGVIADRLNELGYRKRNKNVWWASSIQSILKNEETYRGRYEGKPGRQKPILEVK